MAFSGAQRAAIRNYLGFSELFHDLDPRLESMMSDIDARAPDAEARIVNILTALADVDTRLAGALDNLDLIKAEEVTFFGPVQMEALRDQGRMLIQQMAIILEIIPKRDYYSIGTIDGGLISLG